MKLLFNRTEGATTTLSPAIIRFAGNGFSKNISEENQHDNFGVTNFMQCEVTNSRFSESANNILFANRRNKNNEKLKRRLINFMSVLLFLFLFLHNAACIANEPPPGNSVELPSGIFCLDGMRWEHAGDAWNKLRGTERIYNAEGELIKVIEYPITRCMSNIITYSVRQISENIAELYCSEIEIWRAKITDKINNTSYESDITITIPTELFGEITIEGKKVYYSGENGYSSGKSLLYDFSLNVGDTFYVGSEPDNKYNLPFVLVSIDSVQLIGGEYRKRYNFKVIDVSNPYHSYEFSVVETIGCTQQLFHTLNPALHEAFQMPKLQRVYYKEQLIWGK